MRYRLRLEERTGYLHVEVEGTLDARTDEEIDEAVARAAAERGFDRALLDMRAMAGGLSVMENFDAAATYGARMGPALRRVAIVDVDAPERCAPNRFFESVARNRGASVRFFPDPEPAIALLLEGD